MSIIRRNILYIAWTFALVASMGSLYMSNVLHWTPCVLCWYQRIFLYPLVFVIGAGIIKKITDLEYLVLPLTVTGGAIAFYHSLLQYGIISEKFVVCTSGVSCTEPYHILYPFITVPLLSLITFIAISLGMYIYHIKKEKMSWTNNLWFYLGLL